MRSTNNIRIWLFSAVLVTLSAGAIAQTGVSINGTGTAPDAQAILDITSRSKGVLLPRLSTLDATTLASSLDAGDDGMIIYDTTTKTFKYWNGTLLAWQSLITSVGSSNTLDEAYDQNGPGAGRIINADAGNVEVQGAGYLTVASNIGIGTTAPDRRMKISGTGWTALEVENTDAQGAALELTSQSVSNYVYTDVSGFLGLESAAGEDVVVRTDGGTERLRVQNTSGDVRVINLADASSAVVLSDAQGDLGKTSLTGVVTDVLLGTGSFGPSSAFDDHDWYQTLSTNTPTAIGDWIYTNGRVGIGVGAAANPNAPLEVAATGAGNPANNSILASNPNNSGGNDAIITTRVAGSSAGDPFFSMDISGEFGWSMGVDNDHDNRFKIAPSWSDLSTNTALTIQTNGNVGVGTTAPSQKLQVNVDNNGLNIPLLLRNEDGTEGGNMIGMGFINEVNGDWAKAAIVHERQGGFGIGDLHFLLDNAANNSAVTMADAKMTILRGGNVGVGTTSPNQKLEVAGTARLTSLGGAGDKLVYTNNSGDLLRSTSGINPNSLIDGTGASGRVTYWSDANSITSSGEFLYNGENLSVLNPETSTAEVRLGAAWGRPGVYSSQELQLFSDETGIVFGDSNTERMRMTAAGRLGIGHNAPDAPLTIGDGTTSAAYVHVKRNNNPHINLFEGTTSVARMQGDIVSGHGQFQITSSNGATSRFNVNEDDGNVGIGTTGPGAKLHVNGATSETVRIQSSGAEADIHYVNNNTTWQVGTNNSGNGTSSNQFFVYDNAYRLTVQKGTGNVGVGLANPAHKFEVSGNAHVSDYLKVGNPAIPAATSTSQWNWVYIEEFDNYSYWTQSTCRGSNSFYVPFFSGGYIYYEHENNDDDDYAYSPFIWVPANSDPSQIAATMSAYVCMETSWDGLRAELSINGGGWTVITNFSGGGYNSDADNDCGGGHTAAWSNSSGVTYNPTMDLDAEGVQPGDWVRIRLEASTDGSTEPCFTDIEIYQFTLQAVSQTNSAAFEAGGIYAAGHIFAHSNSHVGDVAEYFPVSGYSEPGDVIAIDPETPDKYVVSSTAYNPYAMGVYSTAPSVLVNSPDAGEPIGLSGRVPVKVTDENGEIKIGDYLTSSSTKGHAMKATKAGYTIGRALETLDAQSGLVMCLIEPGWYNPSTSGNTSGGSFFVSKGQSIITVDDPTMTRDSRVFISMLGNAGSTHWIKEKSNGRFSVELANPAIEDVRFDYFIDDASVRSRDELASVEIVPNMGEKNNDERQLTQRDGTIVIDGKTITEVETNDSSPKQHPQFENSQGLPLMVESDWSLPSPPPNKEEGWIWHPDYGYVSTGKSGHH